MATIAPPFKVASPVIVAVPDTERLLLTVVVPEFAPRLIAVATPPIFKVVAVVLKIFPVALVVVIDPPLTAKLLPMVTFPVKVEVESTVSIPLVWILPLLEMVTPDVPYPPPILVVSKEAVASVASIIPALGKDMVAPLILPVAVEPPIE